MHPGPSEAEIIGESALRYAVPDQSSSSPAPVLAGSYRERLLNYLVARMRSSLELQTILDTAVQELCSVLGADRTVIYRFDKGWRGQVISEALSENTTSVLGRIGSDNCFPQEYAWRYRNGRVRAIADIQDAGLDPCHVDFLNQHHIRANVVVPIFQGSALWGLLVAHQCHVRQWSTDETELLSAVAEHLSVAIRQAYLLKQVRRQAEREQLLLDITQQLRSTLDLETILSTATVRSRTALRVDRVVAYRLKASGGTCCSESVGVGYPSLLHQSYGPECVPEAYLEFYWSGRVKAISDLAAVDLSPCHMQMLDIGQIRAFLVVPVLSGGKLWGLLAAHQCDGPRDWQEEDITLLKTVGEQVGIALEHAELLSQSLGHQVLLEEQNAELQKARLAAEESSRLKSEFLTTISHELRTPLNGIIGTMELVRSECEDNPDQWDLLTMGLSSADELLRLVSNILDMSKIESGPIGITYERVDLERLVKEVVALFEIQARQKSIKLIVDVPSILSVHADEQRLHQVLTNVIGNAIKFTHTGHVIVRAMPCAQTRHLNLEIQDTGIGIAPEHHSQLFQPFVQVDGSSKRRYGGTGLGLAISKELIEQMGGQIQLSSLGEGQGTCVSIVLPEAAARG
ncbi:MAG: GAF domain-containing protein [Gemmatimonadaceae bacterium]|nr:GAF domain-containing protein [Gloeobacterales cyanobacterium ES-bin-141]